MWVRQCFIKGPIRHPATVMAPDYLQCRGLCMPPGCQAVRLN